MFRAEAMAKIEEELSRGEAARRQGLEGRARVCARRAAGAAIREYLELSSLPMPATSAYDLLRYFQLMLSSESTLSQESPLSGQMRQVVEHLLAQVDESFALPGQVDLLSEARWLAQALSAGLRTGADRSNRYREDE